MNTDSIILRHLCFTGVNKSPVLLTFEAGLNVLYGASETGKSFVLEAIDFMLGGSTELRDIEERVGYDRILLGIEIKNEIFTFVRSTGGGDYEIYNGLHQNLPTDQQPIVLSAKHSAKKENSLSNFLLKKLELNGKVIKTKVNGTTRNLSFRDLAHLCLIDEGRIQKTGSPLETSGERLFKTAEYSIFKFLITGIDDSSSTAAKDVPALSQNVISKIELIDELISSYTGKLSENSNSEEELKNQLENLEKSILQEQRDLNLLNIDFSELSSTQNRIRKQIETGILRRAEIAELKARFDLLNGHYLSDLARLEAIREAGALITELDVKSCPLCGAFPDHQHPEEDSYGNLELVVTASDAESQKIIRLQSELFETLKQLNSEAEEFDKTIPVLEEEEGKIEIRIRSLNTQLFEQKVAYSTLIEKRSEIRSAISLLEQIKDLKDRKEKLEDSPVEKNVPKQKTPQKVVDLSTTVLDKFALHVEAVLKAWNFPDSNRVQFDESSRDLIIAGKRRGSRGKGMRSITHAAFIISLLEFCQDKNLPHPGFLVIDSPLLAYREPEDADDDLRGTDVQDKFYDYLVKWTNKQILIIENVTPPPSIVNRPSSIMFTKNSSVGRYGLFLPLMQS